MNSNSQSLMPFMDILTTLVGIIILMTIILALSVVESDTVEVRLHHRQETVETKDEKGVALQPIYIVCSKQGLQIGETLYPLARTKRQIKELREVLDAEIELMGEGAYLFALLRPDGYRAFQQLHNIVAELGVRFGYEPINSRWKLVQ